MTQDKIFNNPNLKQRRRELRNNMTKAEVFLWLELKGKKLGGYKFRRQHSIEIYVVDFYCTKVKLAVEIDGATHITDEEIEKDKQRQSIIEKYGIHFLRFTNEEIFEDRINVLDKILNKVKELDHKNTSPPLGGGD